jgi:hypothetical protein
MSYYRFQEIAGILETVLSEGEPGVLPEAMDFQLRATATTWDCLMRCWVNGVFSTSSHTGIYLSVPLLHCFKLGNLVYVYYIIL